MQDKEENKKVEITISADEYSALEKIAKAMNSVKWCGDDNTVASIIEGFALTLDEDNVMENIINSIDTQTDDQKVAAKRLDALNDAIATAICS